MPGVMMAVIITTEVQSNGASMARPVPVFGKFVGQGRTVGLLLRQLRGAQARGEAFPPALFVGPSGVGKTALAKELAAEAQTCFFVVSGNATVEEVAEVLIHAKMGDFILVDEVHQMAPPAQELFFPVIDDHEVPAWARGKPKGAAEPTTSVVVQPTAIVFATDQPGKLLPALVKRVAITAQFRFYNVREIDPDEGCRSHDWRRVRQCAEQQQHVRRRI